MVALDIVSDVLCVPRVEHPDYPGYDRLKTVSKNELIFAFCEHPSDWVIVSSLLAQPLLKALVFLT